jgi:Fe-S cluster assembly scaffold protein SufB
MGYRHQVISNINPFFDHELPQWFIEKYKGYIELNGAYWHSYSEYKKYGPWRDLDTDIQKALQETQDPDKFQLEVQLVYFADEGEVEDPDIQHVTITAKKITVRMASGWVEQRYVE